MEFYFSVRGDRIVPDTDYEFVEGNKGSYEAVFSFDEAWNPDMAKQCVCEVSGKRYVVPIIGGTCLLPEMVKGSSYIGVVSVLTDYDLVTRISTQMIPFGVSRGAYNGEVGEEFKSAAEIWEIYLSDMEKSRQAAETARDEAQQFSVEASSAAGDALSAKEETEMFRNEASGFSDASRQISEKMQLDAEKILEEMNERQSDAHEAAVKAEDSASSSLDNAGRAESAASSAEISASNAEKYAESIKNLQVTASSGTVAGVKKTETSDGIKLSFTLPKGDKGDQGDRGPAGDKGKDGNTPVKGVDYFTPEDIESLNIPNKEIVENNDAALKSLQYYGDASIVPSDASLFSFKVNEDEKTASIIEVDNGISGDIVVPYECVIDGMKYGVISIGDYAFHSRESLKSIIIPHGVTSIGSAVFEACYGLTNITIPNSVASIGKYTFEGCDRLTDVYFRGAEEQYFEIIIGEYNSGLFNATIHYEWSDVTKEYVDKKIGDIDNALENIIAIQNSLIGGDSV